MMVFSVKSAGTAPAGTNFKIADTLVPAGTLFQPTRISGLVSQSCDALFPLESGAIVSDAMQDNGKFADDRDLGLLRSDAFCELGSTELERRRAPRDSEK